MNYDAERFVAYVSRAQDSGTGSGIRSPKRAGRVDLSEHAATFTPASTVDALVEQGEQVGLKSALPPNADIRSLQHTLLFGIKGICAYAEHAANPRAGRRRNPRIYP